MKLKKLLALVLTGAILAGCGSSAGGSASTTAAEASTTAAEATSAAAEETSEEQTEAEPAAELIHFDSLKLAFVPSRPAEEIITQTSGLPDLLKAELLNYGYEVDDITIEVSSSFEVAGEALSSGAVDLAWLPSGTYIVYSDETEVILTATRAGLSNDSENPADWNGLENKTLRDGPQVSYYKGLIYAGPSEKGQELAAKVNAGEELTWEDLDSARWTVAASVTSNAGYSFPCLWLMENYDGKKITDLTNVSQANYADAFAQAAAEQTDIIVCYADGRTDYEEDWNTPTDKETSKGFGYGREKEIWEECNVIGVTNNIYNDTIAITKAKPEVYNDDFKNAFCDAMLAICETQEGKDIIAIYTHEGYLRASDSDYDSMRDALAAVQ
ncbi:MAG: PhnD/SsuA/transferrin family substrate-binding protein [Lachnospiraceae bacterium]|nr:PhnD/SsuA/transferrin family substrate-binding protein [Lachnospiraceae bacterium]